MNNIVLQLHQNPCFYIKNNIAETEILQQNNIISLSIGDKFGLIPDTFWYEVIHCTEREIPQKTAGSTNESMEEEKREESEDLKSVGSKSNSEDEAINFEMNESLGNPNRSASPSLLSKFE